MTRKKQAAVFPPLTRLPNACAYILLKKTLEKRLNVIIVKMALVVSIHLNLLNIINFNQVASCSIDTLNKHTWMFPDVCHVDLKSPDCIYIYIPCRTATRARSPAITNEEGFLYMFLLLPNACAYILLKKI